VPEESWLKGERIGERTNSKFYWREAEVISREKKMMRLIGGGCMLGDEALKGRMKYHNSKAR
jgi:hypothetical protein